MKKIVFVCGSLEEGKDGVGDYTRRLASELIEQGNEIKIISIADKYVQTEWVGIQSFANVDINVLRLPFFALWNDRLERAKRFVNDFNPEWISLQFVLFSFDKKGLPIFLAKKMQKINTHAKWHIMFHELWVGTLQSSSIKFLIWGRLQKFIIGKLIDSLQPQVIHTQTSFYKTLLEKMYYDVIYLPLFSNIPIDSSDKVSKAKESITLVLFGTIHEAPNFNLLIEECMRYEKKHNQKIILRFAGRNGANQKAWADKWMEAGFVLEIIGEQPVDVISRLLSSADIGITTSAYPMLEKSGSVAAMLDHHLPILCVSKFEAARNLSFVPLLFKVFEVKRGCIEACLQYSNNQPKGRDVYSVANQFIQDLETATLLK